MIRVLDGGMATEIESLGVSLDTTLWSAICVHEEKSAAVVRQVHLAYLEAGADIVITTSYQATISGYMHELHIPQHKATELMKQTVLIAKEAISTFSRNSNRKLEVAASIGCFGAFYSKGSEYTGIYEASASQILNYHREKLLILLETKPDFILFETIPNLFETKLIISLLNDAKDLEVPVWISACCGDMHSLTSGESFSEFVEIVDRCDRVTAVGINCTPPQYAEELVRTARRKTEKSVLCYPNGGELWDQSSNSWVQGTGSTLKEWEALVKKWIHAGATHIGGCCRTSPAHTRVIRCRADETNKKFIE